jgi:tetratricopeptide (TPR) repeat protein
MPTERTTWTVSDDHEGWFARGCALEDDERFHEATRAYRRALQGPERSASVHFNLGNCLYKLRRKMEATGQYRLAVQLDSRCHEAWNNLGVVLCELRQCDDAAWAFLKAIQIAPWSSDAFFNLADCFEDRGNAVEAERYLREYVRLDPTSEWGQYARSKLAVG